MGQNNRMPWIIAAILLIALIVVSFMLIGTRQKLSDVLAQGSSDITAQRDLIAQKCKGPMAEKKACDAALAELLDILREFSADLSATTPSKTAQ